MTAFILFLLIILHFNKNLQGKSRFQYKSADVIIKLGLMCWNIFNYFKEKQKQHQHSVVQY